MYTATVSEVNRDVPPRENARGLACSPTGRALADTVDARTFASAAALRHIPDPITIILRMNKRPRKWK